MNKNGHQSIAIKYLKIKNYRSISNLELNDIIPYSVFAGANGSGKSNFFDALVFVSLIARYGINIALRAQWGFDNIHCFKLYKDAARTFEFEIQAQCNDEFGATNWYRYRLKVQNMDSEQPDLNEDIFSWGPEGSKRYPLAYRKPGNSVWITDSDNFPHKNELKDPPPHISLPMLYNSPISEFLRNIRLFRIEPLRAKEPDHSSQDDSDLSPLGSNLASVLRRLEKDSDIRETLMEWISLVVPGLEDLSAPKQKIDGKTALQFKETGTKKQFPAHLISDGTIYFLCMLVAILDRKQSLGMTLIEEPERGLHPKAIIELVQLMRDNATVSNPIFITTHSETLLRQLKTEELWLVDKHHGHTVMKHVNSMPEKASQLSLDQLWLSNAFDAGLPW